MGHGKKACAFGFDESAREAELYENMLEKVSQMERGRERRREGYIIYENTVEGVRVTVVTHRNKGGDEIFV